MTEFEQLKKLADSFFEWPTEDRTQVTTTSAILFAQHALAVAPRPEAGQPTYETEIERVIARMDSSDPDFDDCADAVALIHRLAAEIKGPDGYATWRDAAIAERVRRVNAEWVGQNGLTRPAEPKCWCHSCRPVTLDDMRMVLCPDCGNKRCPKANDHRHACTSSNEPGQPGSAYPAEPDGGAV